jgi:hypothetical protein
MVRYAFGDESGETGFKFGQVSSYFFIVALVSVDEPQPIRERIEQLKRELGVSARYEFKFNKTSRRFRQAFFAALQSADFRARVLVVDKRKLSRQWQAVDKMSFYVYFVGESLLLVSPYTWEDTYLILDRFGQHRETTKQLRQYIKGHGLTTLKRIVAKRSEGEPLIQLADMIAGAAFRKHSIGDSTYLDWIADKVEVWEYRKKENPPG